MSTSPQALSTDSSATAAIELEPSSRTAADHSSAVRRFYDEVGWTTRGDRSIDLHLFGTKEDGPIRQQLSALHGSRINSVISSCAERVNLLECGCGGNPAWGILPLCAHYTGVDFSESGLQRAEMLLRDAPIPHDLKQSDIRQLPFSDGQFDAVYCAHVLYHIPERAEQLAALQEMLRVLKPGGTLVLITANPRPVLFPLRFAKRLCAGIPGVTRLFKALKQLGPIPYNPPSLGWLRRHVKALGSVEIVSQGLPSTWFHQRISEFSPIGRSLWRLIRYLDINFAHLSAYLGNYALVAVHKHRAAA